MSSVHAGDNPAGAFAEVEQAKPTARHASSVLREAARARRGTIGLGLGVFVLLVAAIGPFLTPEDPNAFVTAPFAPPGAGHLLGGDALGRDVLSRLLAGGWQLLAIAIAATVLGVGLGALIGVMAAFEGGRVDTLLMRTMDVVLAFPQVVFALMLVSVVGPKVWLLIIATGISHMPSVARVIRAAAQDVCERDFVVYGRLIDLPRRRTLITDVFPNLTSPLMVEAGLRLTYSILILAGLSFLGFGLQPPDANWGAMINENRLGVVSNPWGVVAPICMLVLLTVGTNLFTDSVARVSMRSAPAGRRKASRRRLRAQPKPREVAS